MNCREIQFMLDQAVEEGTALPDGVARHLATCPGCAAYRKEMARLWQALDFIEVIQPAQGFQARFWRKVGEQESRAWWSGRWTSWLELGRQPRVIAGAALVLALALGTTMVVNQSGIAPIEQGAPLASLDDDWLLESLSTAVESNGQALLAHYDLWAPEGEELSGFPTPLLIPQSTPDPKIPNRGARHEKIG